MMILEIRAGQLSDASQKLEKEKESGAKKGHPGHRQTLLESTKRLELKPVFAHAATSAFPKTDLYGFHVSLGALRKIIDRVSTAIEPDYVGIVEQYDSES